MGLLNWIPGIKAKKRTVPQSIKKGEIYYLEIYEGMSKGLVQLFYVNANCKKGDTVLIWPICAFDNGKSFEEIYGPWERTIDTTEGSIRKATSKDIILFLKLADKSLGVESFLKLLQGRFGSSRIPKPVLNRLEDIAKDL